MSSRHRLILLATSAVCAIALLCPIGYAVKPSAPLGPLVSAAPPLVIGSATIDDNPLMDALRREAGQALGQLQARRLP